MSHGEGTYSKCGITIKYSKSTNSLDRVLINSPPPKMWFGLRFLREPERKTSVVIVPYLLAPRWSARLPRWLFFFFFGTLEMIYLTLTSHVHRNKNAQWLRLGMSEYRYQVFMGAWDTSPSVCVCKLKKKHPHTPVPKSHLRPSRYQYRATLFLLYVSHTHEVQYLVLHCGGWRH